MHKPLTESIRGTQALTRIRLLQGIIVGAEVLGHLELPSGGAVSRHRQPETPRAPDLSSNP